MLDDPLQKKSKSMTGLRFRREPWILGMCLVLLILVYGSLALTLMRIGGVDWRDTYVQATNVFLLGFNPYHSIPSFFNPAWVFVITVPLFYLTRWLGSDFVSNFLLIFTLASYLFVGWKLHARPVAMTAFLLSPAVLYSFRQLNMDVFVLLGFLMPAPIGLFFVLIKPQVGIGMVIFWLWEAWYLGGIRKVMLTFAPVTIALALNFLVFGNWVGGVHDLMSRYWNYSIWPWGIPLGLVILGWGLMRRKKYMAASSSVFLSPYAAMYSWITMFTGAFENQWAMVGLMVLMWALFLLKGAFLP